MLAAFITKTTFLSDSETASYWICSVQTIGGCNKEWTSTYQWFVLLRADQTVEQIQDFDPQNPNVRVRPGLSHFEVHKGLAQ